METKLSESIGKRSPFVTDAISRHRLVLALRGGTPEMRRGAFVPQYAAETDDNYRQRLEMADLMGAYSRTTGYLTGQVFQKDMELTPTAKLGPLFELIQDDADLQGNDLRTFAQEFFEQALDEGSRFLLVQYPSIRMNEQGQYWDDDAQEWKTRTRKVDQDKGWRPYFIQFGIDQLLGWRYEYMNGVKVLTQLRILEYVTEKGELDVDDETIEQVRLLERGRWSTWRKTDDAKGLWSVHDEGQTSIEEIPLALYMPGVKITDMTAAPALETLAYIELGHFIAISDHNMLMAYARRPVLFGKCLMHDDATLKVSPGCLIHSTDPNADLKSVGVENTAIQNSLEDLAKKEERMALYGLMMLTPTLRASGGKTATQAQQESSESISQLKDWAQSLKDCFDNALKFAGQFEGMEYGTESELKINLEFQPGMGLEPQAIILAVERGILPKQVAFDEFKRRGLISDSYDWEDVVGMMDREQVASTAMPAGEVDFATMLQAAQEQDSLTPDEQV